MKKEKRETRVDMRITRELKDLWLRAANKKGITLTKLIERAVKQYISTL